MGICNECASKGKNPEAGFARQEDNPWSEASLAKDPTYAKQEKAR